MFHQLANTDSDLRTTVPFARRKRLGLSLIEVLIAMTMTLIVLFAMMRAFSFASTEMTRGRAGLEMTNRLRSAQILLRRDLERLTVETKPYFDLTETPRGYFELVEGVRTDVNLFVDDTNTPVDEDTRSNLAVGDFDDVWSGTIRSEGEIFRGRAEQTNPVGTVVVRVNEFTSQFAEVIWFVTFTDADGDGVPEVAAGDQIQLRRRQLLIDPTYALVLAELAKPGRFPTTNLDAVNAFFQNNDISARVQRTIVSGTPTYDIVLNSLEDLAVRGNRFCHINPNLTGTFPFAGEPVFVNPRTRDLPQTRTLSTALLASRIASNGEDVVLTGCLGFDLKVFSPTATELVDFMPDPAMPTRIRLVDTAKPSDLGAKLVRQANISGGAVTTVEDFSDGVITDVNSGDPTYFNADADAWVPLAGAYVDLGAGNGVLQDLTSPRAQLMLGGFAQSTVVGGVTFTTTPDPGPLGRQPFPFVNPAFGTFGTPGFLPPTPAYIERVYDTGTSWYNRNSYPIGLNGIDDDGMGLVDESGGPAFRDAVDSAGTAGANGVFDLDELDTSGSVGPDGILDTFEERVRPPYNVHIRGIQASIRVYEQNSGEIRQMTMRSSLLPN